MKPALAFLGMAVALLPCAAASAADVLPGPAPVSVGRRVRITSGPAAPPTVGTVTALESDTLVLSIAGLDAPLRVPVADIQTVEVSAGRKSQHWRGALIGAAAGAIPGILMTVGDYSDDVHGDDPSPAALAAIGAAGGALVGAGIGWAIKSEKWQPAEVRKVSLTLVPLRGSAAMTLRVAWR